jgi:hypothetical protein
MLPPSTAFAIFYSEKYYKLLWEIERANLSLFERRDLTIGVEVQLPEDIFFGYTVFLEELEVRLMLYLNKGVNGNYLIQAKPQPEFLLFSKGNDPSDFANKFAYDVEKLPGVKAVLPIDVSRSKRPKELLYHFNYVKKRI